MTLKEVVCNQCGANLKIDPKYNVTTCAHCKTSFAVEMGGNQMNSEKPSGTTIINHYYTPAEVSLTQQRGDNVQAVEINKTQTQNRSVALVLCVFLGFTGAHRFYEGNTKMGVIYLLTIGLFGIGWITDIIKFVKNKSDTM